MRVLRCTLFGSPRLKRLHFIFSCSVSSRVKTRKPCVMSLAFRLSLIGSLFAQQSETQSITPTKPLTIDQIFTRGATPGRGAETIESSPDGSKVAYVQRGEKGEG